MVINPDLSDHEIPPAMDIQPIKATIAGADSCAIGIRITELPITPEKIVKRPCLKKQSKTEATKEKKGG